MRGWWRAGLLAGCLTGITLLCVVLLVAGALRNSGVTARDVQRGGLESVSQEAQALNRLVVLGADGNVSTMDPDGGNPVALTTDAADGRTYLYPTWSPDGNSIAFVELMVEGGNTPGESALHIVGADGAAVQRIPTEFPPFYLFWSPTGETLGFLSNWDSGMALRMVDVAEGATEARTVQEGQPFYFSWEPEGQSMLAHIGDDDLTFLDKDGNRSPLEFSGGQFQAPHWSDNGERLAFVTDVEGGGNALNVSDAGVEMVRELASEEGSFSLNWSADNRRLAYSYVTRQVGLAAFGPLWVVDVESNQSWELSREPVVAFFWSPDGQKVAFLRPEPHDPVERAPEASPLRQGGQLWLRWHIWNGERTYPLDIFTPSEQFLLNYIRYFDQYAQSVSIWSPDSTQLLYAGLGEDGVEGIWTLPVAEGSTATRVVPGVLGAWSPR
jgi:TolB protein